MKKVYKLLNTYFRLDSIIKMTKPYCDESLNSKGQMVKCCRIFINDKEYYRTNYIESYSIIIDEISENNYQEFKKDAFELFEAFKNG